jgi:hypothetical protein
MRKVQLVIIVIEGMREHVLLISIVSTDWGRYARGSDLRCLGVEHTRPSRPGEDQPDRPGCA